MNRKRFLDITGSLVGLIILFPLGLMIALLIKLTMPGPVLFRQHRVGKEGKLFKMVKFRSMKTEHHGGTVSIKGESRITPFGAILRKYKMDELPEFWNVLIGDMSLVGPRPHVPGYTDQLTGRDRQILDIRPGITGPASLKYANEEEILSLQKDPVTYHKEVIFPDKVRMNVRYIENRSFGLDLKIIIYTLLGRKLKDPFDIQIDSPINLGVYTKNKNTILP